MFKYWLYFALLTPLAGIILVENGAYCVSCGRFGHLNGASIAFAIYAFVTWLVAFLIMKRNYLFRWDPSRETAPPFTSLGAVALGVNGVFLAFLLFVVGGARVLTGDLEKGEYRFGLDLLGAPMYWIVKFLAPSLLAYLALVYRSSAKRDLSRKLLLAANFAMVAFIGMTVGFKASALIVLIPALIVFYWNVSFRQLVVFGLIAALVLTAGFVLFEHEADPSSLSQIFLFLGIRLTVIQGDTAWYVWDLYHNGESLPPYWRTLLPVVGDRLFAILTGINRDSNYEQWVSYHYELMLTRLAGSPLEDVGRHSITGTPFAEGVIALGSPGFLVFAIIAGIWVGLTYQILKSAREARSWALAALTADYFGLVVFPWLNGGGIAILAHMLVLLGLFFSYLLIKLCALLANTLVAEAAALPGGSSQDG